MIYAMKNQLKEEFLRKQFRYQQNTFINIMDKGSCLQKRVKKLGVLLLGLLETKTTTEKNPKNMPFSSNFPRDNRTCIRVSNNRLA